MVVMGRRIVFLLAVLGFLIPWAYAPASAATDERPQVEVLSLRDVVKPPMASYIKRGIRDANKRNADAIVIEMDTPGGLDSSMRDIIQAILGSDAPVIVYVVPGGRAASAGTFIAMAAHVAAMAPGTSIGAAHPVGGQGEDIPGTLGDKVTNDAAEYIRSLAKMRGRNSDWAADEAVRQAKSLDADGAFEQNVVDLLAPNTRALLDAVDGRVISYNEREVVLRTANARLVQTNRSLAEEFLSVISEPNIAFIMLSLAMLAIFFEFSSPGAIFPGVIGGILLLLSLYSLGTLEANWAGVLLMGLAFGMFAFEIFVTSHGLLAAGGIVSFIVGALMLWGTGAPPGIEIDKRIVFSVATAVGLYFVFVVQAVVRSHRQRPKVGGEPLIGKTAVARTALAPTGMVLVEGEL
ncbi:MAG: nodulation protein NfeD, partial [Chloroflexota bacterium]|nr:nodulation protein NfeD [Chloroflexota bacterium]